MAAAAYDPDGDDGPTEHEGHPTPSGPVDLPPWVVPPPPIPSYVPPQRGYGPQDRAPAPVVRYADWGERVGATLVDWTVLCAALLVATMAGGIADALGTLGGVAWFGLAGYIAWLNGSKGQSPGKAVLGLRVVRDADGTTLGGPVGLVRALVLLLMFTFTGGMLSLLAMVWPLWDSKRHALHDKAVGASVMAGYPRARLGRDLFLP